MSQCNEELTEEQIKSAVRTSIENCKALIREAEILFEHGCWARTVFLAQIASEEIGKANLLLFTRTNLLEGQLDWTGFWHRYKDHRTKLRAVTVLEEVDRITRSKRSVEDELRELKDAVARQDVAKMTCLYSDLCNGIAVAPSDIATEECAGVCLSQARKRLSQIEQPMIQALYSRQFEFDGHRDDDRARLKMLEHFRRRLCACFEPLDPEA